MDYFLFQVVNSFAGLSSSFDAIGIFFARYAIFALPLLIFAAGKAWEQPLLSAGCAAALALAANNLIGLFSFRSRPFVDHTVRLLFPGDAYSKSFPSDHTAAAFAIAMTIVFAHPKAGIPALGLAMLIGVSRIFAGVHYPSDVAAGALMGILSSLFVTTAFKKFGFA